MFTVFYALFPGCKSFINSVIRRVYYDEWIYNDFENDTTTLTSLLLMMSANKQHGTWPCGGKNFEPNVYKNKQKMHVIVSQLSRQWK